MFGVMLVAASFMLNAQTVIFTQNFNASTTLPAGWQSIDRDGNTNDPQFVTAYGSAIAGWDIDVLSAGNNAALSTSWYSPVDTSDDWLITPAIAIPANASLSWKAQSFSANDLEAYEIRVALTNTVVGFLATSPIYTNAAELSTLTTRTSSLAAYSGQTVYIAFRNVSIDKLLLVIDDVQVLQLANTDSKIDSSSFPSRYSSIPLSQRTVFNLSARVNNNGAGTVNNVRVKTEIIELSNNNTIVFNSTSNAIATLASGATTAMLTPTGPLFTPADTGLFLVRYVVLMNEAQGTTASDTVTYPVLVDDTLYAKDYLLFTNTITGALSIGDDTSKTKIIGQIFDVVKNATVLNAEFVLLAPTPGDTIRAVLYSVAGNGQPTVKIAQTALYTITPADTVGPGVILTLPFPTPVAVTAGTRFYLGVTESLLNGLTLATSPAIYTQNQAVVFWQPNGGWAPIDAQFRVAFVLRANLGKSCHTLAVTTTNAVCGQSTGSATVTATPAGSYTYTWSGGGGTNSITGKASGAYQVTVNDGQGCIVTATANINSTGGPAITNTTKVDVNCFGQSTGTATVTATGNNVAYKWSTTPTQQTNATATGLSAGQYTVTVTDNQACITTTTVTITQPATAVSGTATKVADVSCNNGTNGKAVAVGAGGTPTYSYKWSTTPQQLTDSLLNVGSGNYTVTITDSKGCTNTLGVAITQPASAVAVTIVNKTDVTGGQSNGTATASTSGGSSPYTYKWPNSAVTNNAVNGLALGSYTVTVTDSKGCTATATFNIGGGVGISDRNEIFSSLNVFPIPASSVLNIKADLNQTESMTIEMMDVAGKVVYTTEAAAAINHIVTINVNKFAKGVYTVSLKTKSGNAFQQVVVE